MWAGPKVIGTPRSGRQQLMEDVISICHYGLEQRVVRTVTHGQESLRVSRTIPRPLALVQKYLDALPVLCACESTPRRRSISKLRYGDGRKHSLQRGLIQSVRTQSSQRKERLLTRCESSADVFTRAEI